MFVDVLLPVPLPGYFTYAIPSTLSIQPQAGCRVIVPFGNKKTTTGLIMNTHAENPKTDLVIKDVIEILDEKPIVLPRQLTFWQWIADYYLCTLGEVFKAALPHDLKQPTTARKSRKKAVCAEAGFLPLIEEIALPQLSEAQQRAHDEIQEAWKDKSVCLLHGVTSSGKTEIYTHLIAEALQQGKQVLYLLPEIVLTSQLTNRLKAVFGERLGVYHSKYSDRQRTEIWQRQLSDTPYSIIVGVRSSVFLPYNNLGLVIIDEEHETSFKQQDPAPRYNARNVTIMLASKFHARTLLGTATPSLESYYNARRGKYGLVNLTERYGQVSLPEVEVINLREAQRKKLMTGPFSDALVEHIRTALETKEQVIIFQNRRGFAPQITCHVCGWTPRCPHCDVALTLHRKTHRMTCHYCGYTTEIPDACPNCETTKIDRKGFGTERIEETLQELFPEAHIARMDLDTTQTRTAYETLIEDFSAGRTNILVGTQMVTKGLDFERVSVVGILNAETILNQPDFRAYERTYQMLQQVAGRAGRRDRQGLVVLQTYQPDLPLLQQVVSNDYLSMYTEQMQERREFAYPPFTRMIVVYFKHRYVAQVDALARETTYLLKKQFGTRVLGPDEPPIPRVSSLFIRRTFLKLEPAITLTRIHDILCDLRSAMLEKYPSSTIYYDVDPLT